MIPGLKFGQDYYDDLLAKYTHKKELFLKGLDDLHIIHNDPEGAYYVLLDISEFGYDSDLKFCEDLARLVDRKSTRLNSSHPPESRMPSSA